MSQPFVSRVGGVVSADIAVPEHEHVVRFYSRMLTTGARPLWREDLMNNQGAPVIGLGERVPEYAHLPLQWMPHIQVAEVGASVQRALELGGSELMHGKDEAGQSQWAVLLDPTGAAFGLIPVVPAEMLPPTEGDGAPVGCIAGVGLAVPDAAASAEFYRQVIGWSVQDVEVDAEGERYADHTMLGDDGQPAAAVRHARGAHLGLPPVWLIELPVGDLAESVRRVREEGGQLVHATRGDDGSYARAVIEDPVGACVALVPG